LPDRQNIPWAKYIILIDVEKYCLVKAHPPETYVALSYVWGKIPEVLKAMKGNYDELQVEGALKDKNNLCRLPNTNPGCNNLHDEDALSISLGRQSLYYSG
jgi:hypothetical protein